MKEITDNTQPAKWDKLTGRLVAIQPRETMYGHQVVCLIQTKTGDITEVYRTKSMSALTIKYLGWRIALVRQPTQDGKSRIRVYLDESTPPSPGEIPEHADDADYDPFEEDDA